MTDNNNNNDTHVSDSSISRGILRGKLRLSKITEPDGTQKVGQQFQRAGHRPRK